MIQVGHYVSQHQLLEKILSNDDLQKLDKVSCTIKFDESKAKKMKRENSLMNGKSLSLNYVYSQIIDHTNVLKKYCTYVSF